MYCLSLRSLASFPLKLLYFCLKWMCCSRWDLQSLVKTSIPSILETVLLLIEQLKMVLTSALNLDTNISSFPFTLKVKLYFFLFCDSLSTNWRTTVFLSLPSGSPPIASLLTYQQQGFPHKTLVLPAKTVMLGDSFLHLRVSLMCLCEPTHVCYISCSVLSKLSAAVSSSCLYIYHNKHLILWDPWSLPSYQIVPKVSFGGYQNHTLLPINTSEFLTALRSAPARGCSGTTHYTCQVWDSTLNPLCLWTSGPQQGISFLENIFVTCSAPPASAARSEP